MTFVIDGLILEALAAWILMWAYWTRPRLLVLAEESRLTGYRRPVGVVGRVLAAEAIAPLYGPVVLGAFVVGALRRAYAARRGGRERTQ